MGVFTGSANDKGGIAENRFGAARAVTASSTVSSSDCSHRFGRNPYVVTACPISTFCPAARATRRLVAVYVTHLCQQCVPFFPYISIIDIFYCVHPRIVLDCGVNARDAAFEMNHQCGRTLSTVPTPTAAQCDRLERHSITLHVTSQHTRSRQHTKLN